MTKIMKIFRALLAMDFSLDKYVSATETLLLRFNLAGAGVDQSGFGVAR